MRLYYRNQLIGECNIRRYVIMNFLCINYYDRSKDDHYFSAPIELNYCSSWVDPNKFITANRKNYINMKNNKHIRYDYRPTNDIFTLFATKRYTTKKYTTNERTFIKTIPIKSKMIGKLGSSKDAAKIIHYNEFWTWRID